MKFRINSKGETITEVLIGIAVVAVVLASAYTLLNRSYRQSQSSVDRVMALKAAESKLEILRAMPSDKLEKIMIRPGVDCLDENGVVSSFDVNQAGCKIDRYTLKLTKNNNTFTVTAEWDGLLAPIENLKLYYRP
jgi:Tfp pilus assembly protein PilV